MLCFEGLAVAVGAHVRLAGIIICSVNMVDVALLLPGRNFCLMSWTVLRGVQLSQFVQAGKVISQYPSLTEYAALTWSMHGVLLAGMKQSGSSRRVHANYSCAMYMHALPSASPFPCSSTSSCHLCGVSVTCDLLQTSTTSRSYLY